MQKFENKVFDNHNSKMQINLDVRWKLGGFHLFMIFFFNRSVIPKRADERVVVERNTRSVQ